MNRNTEIFLITLLVIFSALTSFHVFANTDKHYHSKYAGQEKREIKSLSADDIEQLQQGKGWGLAKAAELNGVPGPIHLLEMQEEIQLTAEQVEHIERLYHEMNAQAIPLGLQLIQLEKELNTAFANGSITEKTLTALLGEIAETTKQLRYVHLATHLETPKILSPEQIHLYNTLRGYNAGTHKDHNPTEHHGH